MDPIARVMSIAWVESELSSGLEFRIEPIAPVISIVTEVSRRECGDSTVIFIDLDRREVFFIGRGVIESRALNLSNDSGKIHSNSIILRVFLLERCRRINLCKVHGLVIVLATKKPIDSISCRDYSTKRLCHIHLRFTIIPVINKKSHSAL